jgi:hypothetical protein
MCGSIDKKSTVSKSQSLTFDFLVNFDPQKSRIQKRHVRLSSLIIKNQESQEKVQKVKDWDFEIFSKYKSS